MRKISKLYISTALYVCVCNVIYIAPYLLYKRMSADANFIFISNFKTLISKQLTGMNKHLSEFHTSELCTNLHTLQAQ